jgi:hypothetical protein
MHDLTLHPGPSLIARRWETDGKYDDGQWRELDVTARAHEYLFEVVGVNADVTVGDIFRLLDANPLLQQVFRRDFAEELCAEARKGPVDAVKVEGDAAADERIEYIELYQHWTFDSSTKVYGPTQHLQMHGVGGVLQEDSVEHHRKTGERIQWSVSLTPLRELLAFPLRVNANVQVTEDDLNAKAYGTAISQVRHPDVTLGRVIHGLLWELSFHGGPQLQLEVAQELKERVAEVKAGTAELVSADDFFEDLDRPGCDALFDDLGDHSIRDVSSALRHVEDDENAAAWFDHEFNGAVVVKPQFRDRNGREFRKAFRAAGR